jgi:sugar phosphate isomerase/epimerase
MLRRIDRRDFLHAAAGLALGASASAARDGKRPLFKLSLAQASLRRAFAKKELDPLDFARIARRDYGFDAVEYAGAFCKDKREDEKFFAALKKRADDEGVRGVLLRCDGEGALADADDAKRARAVESHHPWVQAARALGCHSIGVHVQGEGGADEQMKRAIDALRLLAEYAARHEINVVVENHGGLSSDGGWLTKVVKKVENSRCGTLPDFGAFKDYDRYKGVQEMMEYAKGVGARSFAFDRDGGETTIDYRKMLKIVVDSGYRGYVGVAYEGDKLSEAEGIRATKKLLEKVREELAG